MVMLNYTVNLYIISVSFPSSYSDTAPFRQRRNLQSTLAAERKKVILYCRREALNRRTKEIAAGVKEARAMAKHK